MILKLFWSLAFIGILITSAEATPFRPKRVKRTFKTHRPIYKLRLSEKLNLRKPTLSWSQRNPDTTIE